MRARDVMSKPVLAVAPDATVKEAADLLVHHGFTALPVLGEQRELLGVVSEADLVADRFPVQPGPTAQLVSEVMTTPARSVGAEADMADVARLMLGGHTRSVPVTEGGQVVGVVTRQDLVRALARDDEALTRDIQRRLAFFGGQGRWTVEVRNGEALVIDQFDSAADRQVATVLAQTVPGVVKARCEAATRVESGT
ncbi:CBS domain-containing protein [Amycolatopsis magusensis]|uniref:CBS domain-containing protein n=1 Tax=Amycolatopsis magusensis TaxID=882444 RepID=UPI0024A845D9|nr:CBS domain-containing protein [Amycolatopsis magusensis]MDI5975894.1 CBS domain-containing protein [Amycolatopsis magusensis]